MSKELEKDRYDNQFLISPPEQNVSAPSMPWISTSPTTRIVRLTYKTGAITVVSNDVFENFPQKRGLSLIFHESYGYNHYDSNYILSLCLQRRVVQNYEWWTPLERWQSRSLLLISYPQIWGAMLTETEISITPVTVQHSFQEVKNIATRFMSKTSIVIR